MEYIGTCLLKDSESAPLHLPFVVANLGGAATKISFTHDGKTLLAAGDLKEGLRAWKVIAPLTSAEKRVLQAEEDAKRIVTAAAAAGVEANRESEREQKFQAAEREKQRMFAAEMENERELERKELAAEQRSIDEDGGDLLNPVQSPSNRQRRPSEFKSINTSSISTVPPQSSPRLVGWLDEEQLDMEREDKEKRKEKKLKMFPSIKSTEDDSKSSSGSSSARVKKLPLLSVSNSPRGNEKIRTPRMLSTPSNSTMPSIDKSSINSSTSSTPKGSLTSRTLASPAAGGSSRNGGFFTSRTVRSQDLQKEKTTSKSTTAAASPSSTADSTVSTPRREKLTSRRRRDSGDRDVATPDTSIRSPTKSPSAASDNNNTRSSLTIATSNNDDSTRRSIRNASNRRGSVEDNASSQFSTEFKYSDFPMDSLSSKARIPSKVQPPLARILVAEENYADIHAGGLYAITNDGVTIASIKQYEGNDRAPCKKLVFIDRIKGKVSTCEKNHSGLASCLTLSDDGRKCIVGTRGGHAYVHSPESAKWTYIWLKLKETDDPLPNLDLTFSPNSLALLASRQDAANPLTVWNVKTQKLMANLNGGGAAAAAAAASSSDSGAPSTSLLAHNCATVKGIWTPDSEHIYSFGWAQEDRTLRMWKTVTRGMNPRTLCLGRLNCPYTYFRPPTPGFFSNAMAISPNGKLLAVGLGLTLFIIHTEKGKCVQYVTLFDLMSQAETTRDEEIAIEFIDPYTMQSSQLSPNNILRAHEIISSLIPPRDDSFEVAAAAAPSSTPPPINKQKSSLGRGSTGLPPEMMPAALGKRASLPRNGLDGLNLNGVTNKRASLQRMDGASGMPVLNKRGSLQRMGSTLASNIAAASGGVNAPSSSSSNSASSAGPQERSAFANPVTEQSFKAPRNLTPMLTYFTSLCFSPASTSIAVATSLGAVNILEISAKAIRGEEDREASDCNLVPARRIAQKAEWRAKEAERAKFLEQEASRKAAAAKAEAEREAQRQIQAEKKAEREARRIAREEARRLKLYAGSLPDPSYAPAPSKTITIDPFNRDAYNSALLSAVEEKGDFLERLDDDVFERRKRMEEREQTKLQEEAALLAPSVKLHGGENQSVGTVKAKQSSFMERLNRDLNKRKDFRDVADKGEYYVPNSIVPVKFAGTLPALKP